jgi:hypothetical protein
VLQLITDILHSKSALSRLSPRLQQGAEGAYAHSLSITFVAASAAAFITLLVSLPGGENDLGEHRTPEDKKVREPSEPADHV